MSNILQEVMVKKNIIEHFPIDASMAEKNKRFKYIDLFSGIGGFRCALDSLGGKSVGYSEIDKKAIETYHLNFKDSPKHDLGDITKINHCESVDVLVGGVPCQSWSVAGKRKGFDDPRGKLWFDTIEMVRKTKPKVFIFENVKGLSDPRNKKNLELIKDNFREMDYFVQHQLLNSYDFGLPQNRTRIFIVGFRKDMRKFSERFEYPSPKENKFTVVDFLDGIKKKEIHKEKFSANILFDGKVPLSRNAFQKNDEFNDFFVLCDTRNGHTSIHSWDIKKTSKREKEVCMAILRNRRKKIYGTADGNPLSLSDIENLVGCSVKTEINSLIKKKILKYNDDGKIDLVNSKNSSGIDGIYRVYLPNSKIFSTLTATGTRDYIATEYVSGSTLEEYRHNFINNILKKGNLRQITSQEAARIQGFPKEFILHSNSTHAHKQLGNAVSPPVVRALVDEIAKTGIFE